jgi:hypothetical protein
MAVIKWLAKIPTSDRPFYSRVETAPLHCTRTSARLPDNALTSVARRPGPLHEWLLQKGVNHNELHTSHAGNSGGYPPAGSRAAASQKACCTILVQQGLVQLRS